MIKKTELSEEYKLSQDLKFVYRINDKTGQTTYIFGRPYFSPDSSKLVSINSDIVAGYSHNGIQLFHFVDWKLEMVFEYEPVWWGAVDIKWLSNE